MIKCKAHAKRLLNTEFYTKRLNFISKGYFLTALFLIFFSIFNPQEGYSQYANEEELKKQAAQYFEDEDYGNGYKAYSQLVSNYPKDANYNYRLGVCMLFTEPDKKKCYTYLEFANKNIKDSEKEAKFYLAKAYHTNFRFDEAIKLYTQYKEIASSSMVKKLLVDREIDACKNGKRLLSNLNELVVLEKKQLVESDYFRSYNLKDIGGKLLVKPNDFFTAADKKKKNKSIVYLPKSGDQLYYASYGSGDNKDIYIVRKLPNGQWSKAENIGNAINTPFDEDFPFLHPNGRVLYFASKGHNSMGGYDIFKSEFNESAGVWGKPVNMDFPINSPNDDILFVTDSLEKTAYFSSSRQSPSGKIDVFKINTERRPPEFIFIKGSVLKKVEGQSLASKISVKDIGVGENVGSFQASETGGYLAKIPNGGKFIFTVETPGFPTQSEGIDIPVNNSLLPYKQYISYDGQKLVIQNTFETNKEDENGYLDYLEVIEEKAKLDVNASDFSSQPITNNGTNNTGSNNGTNTTNTNSGNDNSTGNNANNGNQNTNANTNLNNQQLEQMAFTDAKELKDEADKLKADANDAFAFVNNQKVEADQKEKEANVVIEQANSEQDLSKKELLLTKANELKEEAKKLKDQATLAENIAKQLDIDASNKQKEAELQQKYAEQLKEVNKSKNNKEALAKLEAIQKEQTLLGEQKSTTNELANSIKLESGRKDEEIAKLQPLIVKQKNEVKDIQTEISGIDSEISGTKDKVLLENLKAQKEELNNEITLKNNELKRNEDKLMLLQKESDALKSQADFASNMLTQVKEQDNITSVANNTGNNDVNTNNGTNNAGNNASNNNSTAANNNTNSNTGNNNTNTTTNNETALTGIQKDQKVFENEMVKLNSQPESSNRYEEQNKLVANYIAAVDKEIINQKADLKKAKTAAEKTAINNKIKELEQDKLDKEDDKRINDSKIAYFKNIENNSVANNGNNNTSTNSNTTNNGNVTNTTNTGNDNSANNNSTNVNNGVTNNNSSNTGTSTANNAANTNSTNNASGTALGENKEKIDQLNTEADKLTEEAVKLRKETAALTGTKKQENIKKIQDLENQASAKRFDAVVLVSKGNEDVYVNNQKTIDEYIQANGDKSNPEIAKANTLLAEAQNLFNQAVKIEQEANSEPDINAKTASYSNVEEKEILALKKQEEAVALYKKNNPDFVPSSQNNTVSTNNNNTNNGAVTTNNGTNENNGAVTNNNATNNGAATNNNGTNENNGAVTNNNAANNGVVTNNTGTNENNGAVTNNNATNNGAVTNNNGTNENNGTATNNTSNNTNATNPEVQNKTVELQNAAVTKKQGYTNVLEQLKTNENQANGTSPEIQQKKKEAEQLLSAADELINAANLTTNPNEKNLMLDEANQKIVLATTQLNEANDLSKQLQSQAANNTNNNVVSNNSNANNNAANSNSNNNVANNNATNTNTGNDNATNNNNTTATTNTVVPVANGKLSEAQIKAIQESPDYKSFTTLNNEAVKYTDIADKESSKAKSFYEQATNYLKESNDLRIQLDQLPEGEEKKLKQEEAIKLDHLANQFKAKGDSVNELASNTRAFAESKKMEADAFAQSLDKKVYEDILIASGNQANGVATNNGNNTANNNSGNVNTSNPKYEGYSPTYADNAGKYESDLNTFSNSAENEGNLKGKNIILANYNKAIDTEIAAQKKKLTTANAADKTKINQRIKDLGTQKTNNNSTIATNNAKIKDLNQATATNNSGNTNNTNNSGNTNSTANNTNTNNSGNNNTNANNSGNNTASNNTTNTTGNNNETNNNSTAAITTNGIEIKNGNAYSAARPIPIDEKLPNGIIFAVQIGAFKNQIPNDLFKGLSPLRGETTAQGLIRYQAGRFIKFEEANGVKNDIKKLGYRDAFVVVYKDGQRISLGEAMNELKSQGVTINVNPNETAGITSNTNIPTANTVASTVGNNNPANNTSTNTNTSFPAANVNATELSNVQGMLFTVQIGVYSNEASSTQLYNLKPIYRERLPNGYYRYTAGVYNNIDKVKADRAKVNGLGISDAFVSAYLNGERIKIADALAKMGSGDNLQFPPENPIQFGGGTSTNETLPATNNATTSNTPAVNTNTVTTTGTQPFNNGVTQGPQPTAENGVKLNEEGITFKVQIGAYKNQVPQNVANNFMKIKTWPIGANQVNGLYIYTVGSFVDNKSARPLLEEAKANGIADAFITVYKDGKKLYGAEASSYLNR
ncbi:MAG: hypothetical protein Q8M29_11855 [Bacteroidota bacterium]|nr:hypothetical protein [Bacteroidota bacterium]